jgi:hypothetical protein
MIVGRRIRLKESHHMNATRRAAQPKVSTGSTLSIRALTLMVILTGMVAAGCIQVHDHDPRDDALRSGPGQRIARTI